MVESLVSTMNCHEGHDHEIAIYLLRIHGTNPHPSRKKLNEISFDEDFEVKKSDYVKGILNQLEFLFSLIRDTDFATLQLFSKRPNNSNYTKILPFLIIDTNDLIEKNAAKLLISTIEEKVTIRPIDLEEIETRNKIYFNSKHILTIKQDKISKFEDDNLPFFEVNSYEFTHFKDLIRNEEYFIPDDLLDGEKTIGLDSIDREIKLNEVDSLLHIGREETIPTYIKSGLISSTIILTRNPHLYSGEPYIKINPKDNGFNLFAELFSHHGVRRLFFRNLLLVKVGGDWGYSKEIIKVFDQIRKWEASQIEITLIEDLLESTTYTEMDNSKISDDIANYLKDIFALPFFNMCESPYRPQAKSSKFDLSQPGFFVVDVSSMSQYQEYAIVCFLYSMYQYRLLPHYTVTRNDLLNYTNGSESRKVISQILDRYTASGLVLSNPHLIELEVYNRFELVSFDPTLKELMVEFKVKARKNDLVMLYNNQVLTVATILYDNNPELPRNVLEREELPTITKTDVDIEEEIIYESNNSTKTFVHMASVMAFMREYRTYSRKEIILGLNLDDEFVDTSISYLISKQFVQSSENGVTPTKFGHDYITKLLNVVNQLEFQIENILSQLSAIKLDLFLANITESRDLYAKAVKLVEVINVKHLYYISIGILAGSYQLEVDVPVAKENLLKEFIELVANVSNITIQREAKSFDNIEESESDNSEDLLNVTESSELESIQSNDSEQKTEGLRNRSNIQNEIITNKNEDSKIKIVQAIVPNAQRVASSVPPPISRTKKTNFKLTPEELKPKFFKHLRPWYNFVETDYNKVIGSNDNCPENVFLLYYLFLRLGSNPNQQFIKTTRKKIDQEIEDLDLDLKIDFEAICKRSNNFLNYGSIVIFSNFNDLYDSSKIKLDVLYRFYDLSRIIELIQENRALIYESEAICSLIIREANKKILDQVAAFSFMLLRLTSKQEKMKYDGYVNKILILLKLSMLLKQSSNDIYLTINQNEEFNSEKEFLNQLITKYYHKDNIRKRKIEFRTLMKDDEISHRELIKEYNTTTISTKKSVNEERKLKFNHPEVDGQLIPLDPSLQEEMLREIKTLTIPPNEMLFYVFSKISYSITGVSIANAINWKILMEIFSEVGNMTSILTTTFTRQFADLMNLWEHQDDKEELLDAYRRVLNNAISSFKYTKNFGVELKRSLLQHHS